jgi:hypothetical protein
MLARGFASLGTRVLPQDRYVVPNLLQQLAVLEVQRSEIPHEVPAEIRGGIEPMVLEQ